MSGKTGLVFELAGNKTSKESIKDPAAEGCTGDAAAVQVFCPAEFAVGSSLSDSVSSNLRRSYKYPEPKFSSCGDSEGYASGAACPSQLRSSGGDDLLHKLSNLITGILLNAQMLEWKLPSYSHLKRSVREVERNAQRSAEILKHLIRHCSDAEALSSELALTPADESRDPAGSSPNGGVPVACACHPGEALQVATKQDHDNSQDDLTLACDGCTSSVVPKRDDGKERLEISRRQRKGAAGRGN